MLNENSNETILPQNGIHILQLDEITRRTGQAPCGKALLLVQIHAMGNRIVFMFC